MKGEIKMETTLHFAQNADAGTEESYLRNLPLLKLLAKENIEADDWSVLLAATPNNEDKLLWCLGYTGTLCALDATDRLIVWYVPKNQKEYWFTATTPRDNISLLKSAHRTA